jgi:hypothetical protein
VRRYVRFCGLRVREFHRIREHGQELAGLARVVVLRVRSEEIDDGQTVNEAPPGAFTDGGVAVSGEDGS